MYPLMNLLLERSCLPKYKLLTCPPSALIFITVKESYTDLYRTLANRNPHFKRLMGNNSSLMREGSKQMAFPDVLQGFLFTITVHYLIFLLAAASNYSVAACIAI